MIRMRFALAAMTALLAAGCARDRGPYPNLPFIGVTGQYTSRNLCGLGQTPELQVYDLPGSAARLRVKISNVSALSAPSWESTVPAAPTIPEGALANIPNPCPPELQTYTFRVEMMALASDGRPVAYGWNFLVVQSLARRLQVERESGSGPTPPARARPGEVLRPPYFVY